MSLPFLAVEYQTLESIVPEAPQHGGGEHRRNESWDKKMVLLIQMKYNSDKSESSWTWTPNLRQVYHFHMH